MLMFTLINSLFLMQIHSHDFIILYMYMYILKKRELQLIFMNLEDSLLAAFPKVYDNCLG